MLQTGLPEDLLKYLENSDQFQIVEASDCVKDSVESVAQSNKKTAPTLTSVPENHSQVPSSIKSLLGFDWSWRDELQNCLLQCGGGRWQEHKQVDLHHSTTRSLQSLGNNS